MEAQITIKATPSEFDLIREALAEYVRQNMLMVDDHGVSASGRSDARARAARAQELVAKLS